MEVGG